MPVKTLMMYRKYMGEGGVCVYVPVYGHVWRAEVRACDDSRGIVYVVAGWSQRGRGQFPNPKIWGWLITELEWVHIVMSAKHTFLTHKKQANPKFLEKVLVQWFCIEYRHIDMYVIKAEVSS